MLDRSKIVDGEQVLVAQDILQRVHARRGNVSFGKNADPLRRRAGCQHAGQIPVDFVDVSEPLALRGEPLVVLENNRLPDSCEETPPVLVRVDERADIPVSRPVRATVVRQAALIADPADLCSSAHPRVTGFRGFRALRLFDSPLANT
jgi:hypothetical protein